MERDNDGNILFNDEEQQEFSMPPVAPLSIALSTAKAFQDAASKMLRRVELKQTESEDDNSGVLGEVGRVQLRASRLTQFANGIIETAFSESKQ